ncbi:MAG TPA: hypothetical protein VFS24_20260 [Steroidobacteraceae bacterium]|nr:hypothetical protein [Steroidobacteraceae bacterium]
MSKRMIGGFVVAGLLLAGAAQADCVYPKAPANSPDGRTATKDEMVAGMRAVKEYNAAVAAYQNCLDQESNARVEALGPSATKEQVEQIKAIYQKRMDAAAQELESNAALFNEQVKVFKARDKG